MPASPIPPSSIAQLTDSELEILRLLTAGHTVKSIAARLGRSEASINERLRDARRKTGVGSSRELARSLAAQKIWDRKIDLPSQTSPTDHGAAPGNGGRVWSKGYLAMLIALPIAALSLALAANPTDRAAAPVAQAAKPAASPLVGSWSLDTQRIPSPDKPRSVTIAFNISPAGLWQTRVDIVGQDGSVVHSESTAALDGVSAPVSGNLGSIDSVSLRQPAPGTLVMTLGKDGRPVSTRVYTVSKDRKSMTETIVWASDTLPELVTTYFNRIV